MPRHDKSWYTNKQERDAEKIEEGYENKDVSEGEAEPRARATVSKQTGSRATKKAAETRKRRAR